MVDLQERWSKAEGLEDSQSLLLESCDDQDRCNGLYTRQLVRDTIVDWIHSHHEGELPIMADPGLNPQVT